VTDKGSNRRPSRPEPMFRIHLSPGESHANHQFLLLEGTHLTDGCDSRAIVDETGWGAVPSSWIKMSAAILATQTE
jgi:hypothetical protein